MTEIISNGPEYLLTYRVRHVSYFETVADAVVTSTIYRYVKANLIKELNFSAQLILSLGTRFAVKVKLRL